MISSIDNTLEARIAKLESDNRMMHRQLSWIKRGTLLFGVCVLVCTQLGLQTVQKDAVVLNDPRTGARLIDMVTTQTGAAGFQVWDRTGKRRILLGTNDQHQPGLTMWDAKGTIRVMAGINNQDQAHVTVYDANGNPTR